MKILMSWKQTSRPKIIFIFLVLSLLGLILVSAKMGYVSIPFSKILGLILSELPGGQHLISETRDLYSTVIFEVRLPRILTSATVGAGLAVSGAVFQGILLNPLADPYTLGVSAGAAFGASCALLFGFSLFGPYTVPVFAFISACATLFFVIYLSSTAGGISSNNLILSGVIVTAILSAAISFLKYLAQEKVSIIIFWLLGSFASSTWLDFGLTLILLIIGQSIFIYYARDLNIICLGSRSASSLGINAARTRIVLLVSGSLLAAACVSVSGIIGFIGLLVPHMMRFLVGPDHTRLLPLSLLGGATLLAGADTITRAVLPSEVPIGVLTALIGGPFFCYIFRKRQTAI